MNTTVLVAIPEAPLPALPDAPASSAAGTAGIRLGVLDNSKPNADLLLRGLLERAAGSFACASVLYLRKPNAAINAPPEMLDRLAQEADVVVSAMGD